MAFLGKHSFSLYVALYFRALILNLMTLSSNLGNTLYYLGEFDSAGKYLHQGRKIFNELDDKNGLANALMGLGNIHQARAEWDEAIDCYRQAEAMYKHVGNNEMSGTIQGNIGNVLLQSGNTEEAYSCYQGALKKSKQSGHRSDIARANGNLGTYFYVKGDIEQAVHYVASAYIMFNEIGAFEASHAMAHLIHMLGSVDAVEEYLDQMKMTTANNKV